MEPKKPGPVDWGALAREAFAIADHMTDLEAKRVMLVIARGYVLLAEHAEAREAAKIAS